MWFITQIQPTFEADEALLELRPKSSLLDVHVTAHVEQKLRFRGFRVWNVVVEGGGEFLLRLGADDGDRAAGLMSSFTELLVAARRGAGMRSNFGSGWALAVQDCGEGMGTDALRQV